MSEVGPGSVTGGHVEEGSMLARGSAQANILIADDDPANLKILEEMLRQEGFEVSAFPRGAPAIIAASLDPPDLILLDINMPEMSGYEICRQLKATEKLAGIPVIFLSALGEAEDKVEAFRAGGVDFISKPFEFVELHARVEIHLKLNALQVELKQQNLFLEEAVAARTRELAESNAQLRMLDRSKSDFLNLISHEFRTPLNGLLGISELVMEEMSASAENEELKEAYRRSRLRLLSILDDAQTLTWIDVGAHEFRSGQFLLGPAVRSALEHTSGFAESRRVRIHGLPADTGLLVLGDENLLRRAFQALLETSIKFSAQDETVLLTKSVAPGITQVGIESHGRTIPSSVIGRFFDIFSVGEAINPGGDVGLGPPVAQRILSLIGGSVAVANLDDSSGIYFTVTLRNNRST